MSRHLLYEIEEGWKDGWEAALIPAAQALRARLFAHTLDEGWVACTDEWLSRYTARFVAKGATFGPGFVKVVFTAHDQEFSLRDDVGWKLETEDAQGKWHRASLFDRGLCESLEQIFRTSGDVMYVSEGWVPLDYSKRVCGMVEVTYSVFYGSRHDGDYRPATPLYYRRTTRSRAFTQAVYDLNTGAKNRQRREQKLPYAHVWTREVPV